jgi:hypothetical protein
MKYSIFTMLFMSLFLWSCNQEELMVEQDNNQEVYTVRLNLNGDIQTEESPLSRAETASRDLYGIQVYKDGNYFAAGMFDKIDDITINLLAGGKYKFVCTSVKDGKDKLFYESYFGYGLTYYSNAFSCNYGGELWANSNNFYYSTNSNYSMTGLKSSYTTYSTTSNLTKRCAEIDRFYGEINDYTPTVEGVVNLDLKRVSFGIKVKVSNIIDGNVTVKCYNSDNTFINETGLTSDYETVGKIFAMQDIYSALQYASSYIENITMEVIWNRGVGVTQSWKKTIQMKRNAMNVIRIKLGAGDNDNGVGITPEQGEMGNEEEDIPLG